MYIYKLRDKETGLFYRGSGDWGKIGRAYNRRSDFTASLKWAIRSAEREWVSSRCWQDGRYDHEKDRKLNALIHNDPLFTPRLTRNWEVLRYEVEKGEAIDFDTFSKMY